MTKARRRLMSVGMSSKPSARVATAMGRTVGAPDLLGKLLQRTGVTDGPLPLPMPPGVRKMAPARVQEAMKVVEDYVAGIDDGGSVKAR